MKRTTGPRAWTPGSRSLAWSGLCGLLLSAGSAAAQLPDGVKPAEHAPLPRHSYLNKRSIRLPIDISPQSQALYREIQLYMRQAPNTAWQLREKISPSQTSFALQVPHDGEFAFTMVTVDQQGKAQPADLQKEPAALTVHVDTVPPQLEFANLGRGPEGLLFQCIARDVNLDPYKLRVSYQAGDQQFRQLEPLENRPNIFAIPPQAVFSGLVRAEAADLAGNATVREVALHQLGTDGQPKSQGEAGARLPVDLLAKPPTRLETPLLQVPPLDLSASAGPVITTPPAAKQEPAGGPHETVITNKPAPADAPASPAETKPAVRPDIALVRKQLVNSRKVNVDYQLEQLGASGVGRVEIWATRDKGQTWQKVGEDPARRSPAQVALPGEGLYGITMVVSNGRGFGATPPVSGDTPQQWIEVDTTKPTVQFKSVPTAPDAQGRVHLSWVARDENFSPTPVELYVAWTRQGPWQPVTREGSAEGETLWSIPADAGPQAFFRLVARDLAGNLCTAETSQPVLLDDQSRPRGQIVSISPVAGDH